MEPSYRNVRTLIPSSSHCLKTFWGGRKNPFISHKIEDTWPSLEQWLSSFSKYRMHDLHDRDGIPTQPKQQFQKWEPEGVHWPSFWAAVVASVWSRRASASVDDFMSGCMVTVNFFERPGAFGNEDFCLHAGRKGAHDKHGLSEHHGSE